MRFVPWFVLLTFALTSGYLTLAEHDRPSGRAVTQHLVWGLHAIILGSLIPILLMQSQRIRTLEERVNHLGASRPDAPPVAPDAAPGAAS